MNQNLRHRRLPGETSHKVAGVARVLRLSRGRLLSALKYFFVNTAIGARVLWQPQILPAPANPTTNLQRCNWYWVPKYENQTRNPGWWIGCPGAGSIRRCHRTGTSTVLLTSKRQRANQSRRRA